MDYPEFPHNRGKPSSRKVACHSRSVLTLVAPDWSLHCYLTFHLESFLFIYCLLAWLVVSFFAKWKAPSPVSTSDDSCTSGRGKFQPCVYWDCRLAVVTFCCFSFCLFFVFGTSCLFSVSFADDSVSTPVAQP